MVVPCVWRYDFKRLTTRLAKHLYRILLLVMLLLPICCVYLEAFVLLMSMISCAGRIVLNDPLNSLGVSVMGLLLRCLVDVLYVASATPIGLFCGALVVTMMVTRGVCVWPENVV